MNIIFSKTIGIFNRYFPVNACFCENRIYFCPGRFLKDEVGPSARRNTDIYNCQTATLWYNVFFVYFSLFCIKFSPIRKIQVHNHVKMLVSGR